MARTPRRAPTHHNHWSPSDSLTIRRFRFPHVQGGPAVENRQGSGRPSSGHDARAAPLFFFFFLRRCSSNPRLGLRRRPKLCFCDCAHASPLLVFLLFSWPWTRPFPPFSLEFSFSSPWSPGGTGTGLQCLFCVAGSTYSGFCGRRTLAFFPFFCPTLDGPRVVLLSLLTSSATCRSAVAPFPILV